MKLKQEIPIAILALTFVLTTGTVHALLTLGSNTINSDSVLTLNPSGQPVAVNGTLTTNLLTIRNVSAVNNLSLNASGVIYINNSRGRVGIGTTSPDDLLHINSGALPTDSQLKITANSQGALELISYRPDDEEIQFDL